jgi:O-antigen ligase
MFLAMPFGTSAFTIAGFVALFIWLITGEFYRKRDCYLKSAWLPPMLAVVILLWVGLLWSTDPSGLGQKYAGKSYYWLFGLVVASIDFENKAPNMIFWSYLGGLLLNAILGLLQVFKVAPNFSQWTGTGLYGGYNTLAILLVLGMLMASFYFKTNVRRSHKIIFAVLTAIYFLQIIFLRGRGGYLSFLILSPLIICQFVKKTKIVVLIFIMALIMMASSPVVRDRIHELITNFKTQKSNNAEIAKGIKYSGYVDRIYMWRWAGYLFLKSPIWGVGTGGYNKALLAAGGDREIAHPHNNILYVAVSFGVIGLIVYGWLFWVLLKIGWQHKENVTGFFILSSALVILVGGLVDTPILDAGGAFLLSMTVGFCSKFNQTADD